MTAPVEARPRGLVVLRGRAKDVSSRIFVYGKNSATALTEVRLKLDDLPLVSRVSHYSLDADEDDDLIVAGYYKHTEVWVCWWWNNTKGRGYEPKTWLFELNIVLSGGLAVLFTGLACWQTQFIHSRLSFGIVMALVMSLAMVFSGYEGRKALRLIRDMRASKNRPSSR